MSDDHDHKHEDQTPKLENGKLSGQPIYRRGEGYVTATKYELDAEGNVTESVSAIDAHGHEHQVASAKISRGREKHIFDQHKEHLKMIEKHQKMVEQNLEELALRKTELARQKISVEHDIGVLESRVQKQEK